LRLAGSIQSDKTKTNCGIGTVLTKEVKVPSMYTEIVHTKS